jgi:hypothetical protein
MIALGVIEGRHTPELARPGGLPTERPRNLPSELGVTRSNDVEAIDLANSKCDVEVYSIISSHKIQKRVSTVLRHLAGPSPDITPTKPRVVVLRAKSHDAGKLISVAEIAKRELAKHANNQGYWYQYITLGEVTVEHPRRHEEDATVVEETSIGNGSDRSLETSEQDGFEVMKTPFERATKGRPTVRTIPTINLFLSRVSIESLKRQFGEQTNMDADG